MNSAFSRSSMLFLFFIECTVNVLKYFSFSVLK